MSKKSSFWVATGFALMLLPFRAGKCRGDAEDLLWEKFRQRREVEALELKRTVADALAKAQEPAPEKALGVLRASLSRLRDDTGLSKEERRLLIGRVADRLHEVKGLVAAKARQGVADGKHHSGGKDTAGSPRRTGQAGGAAAQVTPVVVPGQPYVRVGVSGTFVAPPGFPALGLSTTVSVPDGGTVTVGGSSSLAEARNEFGAPGLGKAPSLGRLFRNTAYGREVRSYRLLLGVRAISLRAEDQRLLGQAPSR